MTEPTTAAPTADTLRATLRRLAETEDLDLPILSVYLDVRDDIATEAETFALDVDARNDLVRLAALTSAEVEVTDQHDGLEHAGGAGALLRYRPD
ncbi:MAG TPA: hypothetical protein VM344_01615 [Vitreimonas sp.]|jgi:hypothetical protein|nr:hypothetical protein [Vitreimonas sp.]